MCCLCSSVVVWLVPCDANANNILVYTRDIVCVNVIHKSTFYAGQCTVDIDSYIIVLKLRQ